MKAIRIGAGAGFADDRIEPAAELVTHGDLDYLIFECLAERTIALAQRERLHDPNLGYDEWLEDRMDAVLTECARRKIRIITNMGAANPLAAARVVGDVARRKNITGLKIAAITGDDVLGLVQEIDPPLLERDGTLSDLAGTLVSANAYLGAEAVVAALTAGADIVITGRIADPSLFLAPMIYEFCWATDNYDMLACGLAAGHMLECAGQLTGGYFADPGFKEVPRLSYLGFPIAEVRADGYFEVSKVDGSGGEVSVRTCTEQILYEVHDPANYASADVVANFAGVQLKQVGPDRVAVTGLTGSRKPDQLKVCVGYRDGWIGTGEISYGGANASERGQLALDIVAKRLALLGVTTETRFELIGSNAVRRGGPITRAVAPPPEVRVRVAGRTRDLVLAKRIGREVTSLWLNGPAGGGGRSAPPTR